MKHINIIEILGMVVLLLLFGVTSISLVGQGSDTYEAILQRREEASSLRVASNYITMRVRQSDSSDGRMELRDWPQGQYLAIPFAEDAESEYRIYLHNGYLCEYLSDVTAEFDQGFGEQLVRLDSLSFTLQDALLTVVCANAGEERTVSVSLRSGVPS